MKPDRHWSILAVAVGVLFAGVIRSWQEGRDGWLIAGAALIILGAWLATEIHDGNGRKDKDRDKP